MDENLIIYNYLSETSNGLMLDIGACHGGTCIPFLESHWEVHAFEPSHSNRKILIKNTKDLNGITINKDAVTDELKKDVTFFTSGQSVGIHGLSSFDVSHKESGTVNTTTLSKYIQDNNISCVDYLKIDTEGYDLMVLKGFPWDKIKPKVIQCEFEDFKTEKLGYNFNDLGEILINNGYELIISEWFPIVSYGVEHRWKKFQKFPSTLDSSRAWGNFLAFYGQCDYPKLMTSIHDYCQEKYSYRPRPFHKRVISKIKRLLK